MIPSNLGSSSGAPTSRSAVVFVLGMARSGTSALARVLSLCGGALPSALVGAMPDNPAGHGQPRTANSINEKILRRFGSSGFDPTLRLQEKGAFDTGEKAACIAEIQGFLSRLPAAPFVIIKDPRITLLADMWFEAARLAGFDVAAVIAVRQPKEVIAPGTKRTSDLPELSNALWLKHNLVAEADTREVPRVFVEHANLLADWRREMKRISLALGINLDTRDEDAVERFLEPNLHRPPAGGPPPDHFGADWISVVYDAQTRAARDEPLDQAALDRVFEAYRTSEHGYRAVFEGFQRLDKMNRHVRPSVMKMLNKARATANRRRGNAT
jgi:hypothetical protein